VLFKSYYDLLELPPTSSPEEVKKAFRSQIARYHPDKVQHLGKEFQAMAAERAAELTEAYRILSDAGRRAEYDRTLGAARPAPTSAAPPPYSEPAAPDAGQSGQSSAGGGAPRQAEPQAGGAFTQERATRDEWFLKAAVARFRQALEQVGGDYDPAQVRGFEIACVPKSKMFGKKGPRLLGRFVSRIDGPAVADAWAQAGKWNVASDEICVFLMGTSLATARELAGAIAEQRKKSRTKVTLIPVDARDWNAHMPTDAPTVAKTLLAKLKSGT
jgi:curved DNA-binding protein CbpA